MNDAMIGKQIGRYKIIKSIGEGGMATVYLAEDLNLHRHVAVKMIRTEMIPPQQLPRLLERFKREAAVLAQLSDDPGIVTVYDYDEYENTPYLAMAYMPKGSLKDHLKGPLDYRLAARLLAPVTAALSEAHSLGIIHRDVKLSNLLINRKGGLALADFGIAKALELGGHTLTGTGMGVGTPEYMAPEQWKGIATPQSDIYSLGVVFYEMVVGQKPFSGVTPSDVFLNQMTKMPARPRQFVPDIPGSVEVLLSKALARDPQRRFASMLDMRDAFLQLSGFESVAVLQLSGTRYGTHDLKMGEDESLRQAAQARPIDASSSKLEESAVKKRVPEASVKKRSGFLKGLTAALVGAVLMGLVAIFAMWLTPMGATAQVADIQPDVLALPSPLLSVTVTPTRQSAVLPVAVTSQPVVVLEAEELAAKVIIHRAIIRIGPGENYRMLCYLDKGSNLEIIGRNHDGTWVQVVLAQDANCYNLSSSNKKVSLDLPKEQPTWVSSVSLTIAGDTQEVVYVIPPPTETPIVVQFASGDDDDAVSGQKVPAFPSMSITLPPLCDCVCAFYPCNCPPCP